MSYSVVGLGKTYEDAIAMAKGLLETDQHKPIADVIEAHVQAANSMVVAGRKAAHAESKHNQFGATFNGHVDTHTMGGSSSGTSVTSWYDERVIEKAE